MPIIKAEQSAALLKSAIVLDLGDLARQGECMRQAAQERAAAILEEAAAEAQRLIAAAKGQGFEAGQAQGVAQGLEDGRAAGRAQALAEHSAKLADLEQRWQQAFEGWENLQDQMRRQAQQAVLALALELAQKIVHRQIAVDASVIVDQMQQALAYVLKPTQVQARIHPDDRPTLTQAMPGLLARLAHLKQVELVDDPAVARGGCLLTYGQGRIDATLRTQLDRMVELLLPSQGAGQ